MEPTLALGSDEFRNERGERISGFSVHSDKHFHFKIPHPTLFGIIRVNPGKLAATVRLILEGFSQREVAATASVNQGTARKVRRALIVYLGEDKVIQCREKACQQRPYKSLDIPPYVRTASLSE